MKGSTVKAGHSALTVKGRVMPAYVNTDTIARQLDDVQRVPKERSPGWEGFFSYKDLEVLRLLGAYPQLEAAHSRFSRARLAADWAGVLPDAAWSEMQAAAGELADAARSLGNIDIALCQRRTESGEECGHALVDGACALNWHTDQG
jgi:hypothetical protein